MAVKSFREFIFLVYPQADILVSELLGSFGDNELSPECLDGAQSFLKGKWIFDILWPIHIFRFICLFIARARFQVNLAQFTSIQTRFILTENLAAMMMTTATKTSLKKWSRAYSMSFNSLNDGNFFFWSWVPGGCTEVYDHLRRRNRPVAVAVA